MAKVIYNLSDYNKMVVDYKLPQETLTIINNLSKKLGISQNTHTISTPLNKEHKKNGSNSNLSKKMEESWISTFKPTNIIEKREGSDKIMNDIRIALNKISTKNYETNRNCVIEKINELSGLDTKSDDLPKIANTIFEIASTNKFFSDIYAKLYKELMDKFPEIFTEILDKFIQGFTEKMKTIKYIDQNVNYDEFCKYNKENDKKKATSVFIINLVKEGVLDSSILFTVIQEIQTILDDFMFQPNKTNEVDEIVENVFLLFISNGDLLKQLLSNQTLLDKVKEMAAIKPKEIPSLSSRAVFKYMDILDKMK